MSDRDQELAIAMSDRVDHELTVAMSDRNRRRFRLAGLAPDQAQWPRHADAQERGFAGKWEFERGRVVCALAAVACCACYAMSGTEIAYAGAVTRAACRSLQVASLPILLRACYAKSGTGIRTCPPYRSTPLLRDGPVLTYTARLLPVSCYALATLSPVLIYTARLLSLVVPRAGYAVLSTDIGQ
eukprot:2090812-Rhodomonas_salina.2